MNERTKHHSEWNQTPGRDDMRQFAPLILAALWRSGAYRGVTIGVDRVLAVFEEAGWNVPSMTWGDLCAVIAGATHVAETNARTWRARALNLGIPAMVGMPIMSEVAELAVRDETLHELINRE